MCVSRSNLNKVYNIEFNLLLYYSSSYVQNVYEAKKSKSLYLFLCVELQY